MDEHMEQVGQGAPEPAGKASKTGLSPRVIGIAALVVIALVGGMYLWKSVSENRLVAQLEQAEAQRATDRQALLQQARDVDARKTEAALRQFAAPFSWAVRREAMANNLDQIDQYFTDLVQMPGFESATLARPDGKIAVATDRKRLGQAFEAFYSAAYLQADQIQIIRLPSGNLGIMVPILGLNQKLATAVVEFKPGAYPLQ